MFAGPIRLYPGPRIGEHPSEGLTYEGLTSEGLTSEGLTSEGLTSEGLTKQEQDQ